MRAAARLISALLAIALAAAALVVVVEAARKLAGAAPWLIPADEWLRIGRTSSWAETDVRLVLVGLLLAGLALIAFALWPRRVHAVATPALRPGVDLYVERRGLERFVGRRVQRVDGVRDADVRVKRSKVAIDVRTTPRTEGAAEAVRATAASTLAGFGLDSAENVSVHVQRRAA